MRRAILLLVLSSAACSTDATLGLRRYQLTGVVVGRETPPRIVVEHDAVNGFMPAMRMAFEIGDPAAPPLNMGDRIAATLVLSDTRSWLENVKVTARAGAPATRPPEARAVPGTVVPDLTLVNQNGEPFTLRDAGGRVRIVTFIYTRCPLPDFCPLMVRNLEAVRRRASEEGLSSRLALLGVTLDPAFDTAAVLRAYGESMLKGSSRFDQWTLATGTPAQIEAVTRFSWSSASSNACSADAGSPDSMACWAKQNSTTPVAGVSIAGSKTRCINQAAFNWLPALSMSPVAINALARFTRDATTSGCCEP